MIEQITNTEELNGIIEMCTFKNPYNLYWVVLRLSPEEIEQWKYEGYFKHLNIQLQNIDRIKFSCVQNEDGICEYHFILQNSELKNRIFNMITDIFETGAKKLLVKYSTSSNDIPSNFLDIEGEVRACSLF